MWSNFHTHSHYCDGKGSMEDYLMAAKDQRVGSIGFSSHAPLPFPCKWCMKRDELPNYLQEISSASRRFPEAEIYSGLEVDYIPGVVGPSDFRSLDFTIGSIHFAGRFNDTWWEIDNTLEVFKAGLEKIFKGDIRAAIMEYYDLTRDMMRKSRPDILGHLDKIKINAKHFSFAESEPWYVTTIDDTLKSVMGTNTIIEANTRGIYKKKSEATYPSPWILERILHYNIPITISSDAHHPDDLTREFESTWSLINEIGFKNVSVLKSGIWKKVPLNEYGNVH
jgi:histidinol-phosphatase (PHP family)